MRVSRKIKAICLLLVLALAAFPAMAQGGGEKAAPSGPVEIKIATWTSNPDQIALLNSFVEEFAAKEGIEISAEFESIEFGEYNTRLSLELQGTEAPDVFWVLETSAPAFIQSGLLAELDAELAEYNPDDFFPKAMELWQKDGKTYAVPFSTSPFFILYNADLFAAAGIETPEELVAEGNWNWDTFREASKAIKDATGVWGYQTVDGGGYDENQFLLDGIPVYHPGHLNSLLPIFNGDAIKNIIFHKGFFPTHLEGRLSSVTEVNLKDGNKEDHIRTLTLDMPAASMTLEGPIIKNKLSYMVSARRSWLDFFDNLLSEENRLNHTFYDYNAKLSYFISPLSSITFLAYGARDDYHLPLIEEDESLSILRWDNQAYKLSYHTQIGKLGSSTSLFYSSHTNRARTDLLGFDVGEYIHSGIKSWNVSTEFDYSLENVYRAQWGVKYSYEVYAGLGADIFSFSNMSIFIEAGGGFESYTDNLPDSNHLGNGFARINVGMRGFIKK